MLDDDDKLVEGGYVDISVLVDAVDDAAVRVGAVATVDDDADIVVGLLKTDIQEINSKHKQRKQTLRCCQCWLNRLRCGCAKCHRFVNC